MINYKLIEEGMLLNRRRGVDKLFTVKSTSILVVLLILIPLLRSFQGLSTTNYIGPTTNYLAVGLALFMYGKHIGKIHLQTMVVLFTFLGVYLINYFGTSYASAKWLINSFGYMLILISVVTTVRIYNEEQLRCLSKKIDLVIGIATCCFIGVFLWIEISEYAVVVNLLWNGQHNSNIHMLTTRFNIVKSGLAVFFYIVIPWNLAHWAIHSLRKKMLFLMLMMVGMPFWLGIRSLLLASILLLLFLLVTRKGYKLLIVALTITSLYVSVNWRDVIEVVAIHFDRLPSLLFAIDTLVDHPLGLGNGGYHIVAAMSEQQLYDKYAEYASSYMKTFWLSPESALVYLIASFGVLSVAFGLFYILLLSKGRRLLQMRYVLPVEKAFLLSCFLIIFAGITQNYVSPSDLIWWIYISVGLGVVARHSLGRGLNVHRVGLTSDK